MGNMTAILCMYVHMRTRYYCELMRIQRCRYLRAGRGGGSMPVEEEGAMG